MNGETAVPPGILAVIHSDPFNSFPLQFVLLNHRSVERKLWAQIAVVAPIGNVTLDRGTIGAGVDVVAVVSDEGIIAPADAAVVEEDVLAFAAMIAAVHDLHVRLWRIGAEILPAVDAVIAVGGDGVFSGCAGRMAEFCLLRIIYVFNRWVLIGKTIA